MINKVVVITKYQNKLLAVYICDNKCVQIEAFMPEEILGNIYLARVTNVSHNIQAYFVQIAPDKNVYVPFSKGKNPPKQNDELPIKIVKDGVKTKDPVGDDTLSIDGQFSVVTEDRPGVISYSNKLSKEVKQKISAFLSKNLPMDTFPYGIIVRTSAEQLTDYQILLTEILENKQKLEDIGNHSSARTCYSLLYQGTEGFLRFLRGIDASEYEKVVTDDPSVFNSIKESFDDTVIDKLELYEDAYSLTKLYSLETKISEVLSKKIWLPSGGSIYIEPTEALTVIDVNTGKCIQKKDKETLFLQINMEAVREIGRQIILRNISGIIIIDFINLSKAENRDTLISYLKEYIAKDKIKTDYIDMTPLGLVELTRKKVRKSFYEQLKEDS